MKLNDIFTRSVVTAKLDDTLAAAALRMKAHNVGDLVVVEDNRPVGILTDRDLALALGANGIGLNDAVGRVMTRRVLAIPEDADVLAATRFIRECGVRRLPIVDKEDRLVGIVSLDDLFAYLCRELFNLAEGIHGEMKTK